MYLNKSIEAAREALKILGKHRGHLQHPDGYCEGCGDTPCSRDRLDDALSTLPAKPLSEDEISDIIMEVLKHVKYLDKHAAAEDIIRALRDAGVLYVSESGE